MHTCGNKIPSQQLIDALRAEFGESELHAIAIYAEHPDRKRDDMWIRLAEAARQATDCPECHGTTR